MTIQVVCKCGRKLNAPDSMAGKKSKCPACKTPVLVPDDSAILEAVGAAYATPPQLAVPWQPEIDDPPTTWAQPPSTRPAPKPAFQALELIALFYRIIGSVIAICLAIAGVGTFFAEWRSPIEGGVAAAICIVFAVIVILFYFAVAEAIRLAIAVEANSRRSADALERLVAIHESGSRN